MNIEHIQEFLELASCLNFTEAAKRLNLTQPALSKHISSLEAELGVKLFDRSHRRVHLTDVGCVFLQGAGRILDDYNTTVDDIRSFISLQPLNIAVEPRDPDLGNIVSTAVFAMKTQSRVPVNIKYSSADYRQLLKDDAIDLFIGYVDLDEMARLGFECEIFSASQLAVCLGADNPLAQKELLAWADLKGQAMLEFTLPEENQPWRQIEGYCRKHGFMPETRQTPVSNLFDCLGAPMDSSEMYIWKASQKELWTMAEIGGRVVRPLEDADNMLITHAVYKPGSRQRLEGFFRQAKTAQAIVDQGY